MSASSFGKCPHRNPAPPTKLVDANNTEHAGLHFQHKTIYDHRVSREAQDASTGTSSEILDATSRATSITTTQILDTTFAPELSGHFPDKEAKLNTIRKYLGPKARDFLDLAGVLWTPIDVVRFVKIGDGEVVGSVVL
jgi:hypothetical protein